MCEYSREEFVSGLVKLGAETLTRLRSKLPELRASLAKADTFRAVYAFAYDFSREVRPRVPPLRAGGLPRINTFLVACADV